MSEAHRTDSPAVGKL